MHIVCSLIFRPLLWCSDIVWEAVSSGVGGREFDLSPAGSHPRQTNCSNGCPPWPPGLRGYHNNDRLADVRKRRDITENILKAA